MRLLILSNAYDTGGIGSSLKAAFERHTDWEAALGYPVLLNDGPGRELIDALRPDVLAIGTDWARRDYLAQIAVDQDFLDERRITLAYVPMRPVGISSTEVLRRCQAVPV